MKRKQPEEKMIGEKLCYNKRKSASYIGVSLSKINEIILVNRVKKIPGNMELKFIQMGKGAEIWIPKDELDLFILRTMNYKV